jgi:hypothetical protein
MMAEVGSGATLQVRDRTAQRRGLASPPTKANRIAHPGSEGAMSEQPDEEWVEHRPFSREDVDLLRSAFEFFNTTEGRYYIDPGEFDGLRDLADRIERLLPPREVG